MENNYKEKQEVKEHKSLSLTPVCEGLRIGTKKNGIKYSVRTDRSSYFFPDKWETFFNAIKDEKKPIFDACINTPSHGGKPSLQCL